MADRGFDEVSLQDAWRALGRRLAVAAGSLVALVSLFHHVPISVASLRGGAAFLAVLFVSRLGRFALERTAALDASERAKEAEKG